MKVTSLEKAEQIVNKFHFLEWDGWDILRYKPDPAGFYRLDGCYKDGKWWRKIRYPSSREGWDLPAFLVK